MRCPRCHSTQLDLVAADEAGMVTCRCGLRAYAGYLAEADALDARRAWLADRIAAGDPAPDPQLAARYGVWGPPGASQIAPSRTPPPPSSAPPAQTLLLGLGALLLVIAGAVFAAVVWQRLGAAGQVVLMLAATVGVGALATRLRTRLSGTAEALAVVAAGLAVVDLVAAPFLGLLPERWLTAPTLYPAVAILALGLALLALHARFGLRAWCWLGWVAVPVAAALVVLAIGEATDSAVWPAAALAIPALTSVALLAAPTMLPALRAQSSAMQLAGLIGSVLTGGAVLDAAASREALPGAVVTSAVTAAALLAWGLPARAMPAGQEAGSLPTELTHVVLLAAAGLMGATLGMTLALPADPQPIWLAGVVAAVGLALGLVVVGLLGEPWAATMGAVATWLTWASLRLNTLDFLSPSDAVQAQCALLAALVAVIALITAWWWPWTGWVGAVLGVVALVLSAWDLPDVVESVSLPFAALLLIAGLLWHRAYPGPSLLWLGPAVTAALIPSALATWNAPWAWGDEGDASTGHLVRLCLVLLCGVAAAIAGTRWRLGGLLIPAVAALSIAALAQLVSGLANLPRWVGLGLAGTLLIVAGARVELLRREGRRAAAWVGDLR